MTTARILLLIAAFLALVIGSFVWFVITWSPEDKPAITFILENKLPPEAAGFREEIRGPATQEART